jgi:hypothetical protein
MTEKQRAERQEFLVLAIAVFNFEIACMARDRANLEDELARCTLGLGEYGPDEEFEPLW